MVDLKTTKEKRARTRELYAGAHKDSLILRAIDDIDTLEAEVERLRGVLQEVNDARVTEHGLELSRDLLSRIWAMTNEEPKP